MKKTLIITGLLASSILLSGCGANKPETDSIDTDTTNTGLTTQELLEMPEVIETESGDIITVTGSNTTTSQIKALIDKRREEMKTETGNDKELNEKDIAFLEEVLAKISKKK